jgi:hypothetical protein
MLYSIKKNVVIKQVLQMAQKVIKIIFPKSRWGNVLYLVIGFLLSYYEPISEFIQALLALFK